MRHPQTMDPKISGKDIQFKHVKEKGLRGVT